MSDTKRAARAIRVLIVDDEAFVRDSLEAVMAAQGFAVRTAPSVRAAQALVQRHPFDVIVTDLRMPGEGGLMLVDEARAQVPPIPILVVTGAGSVSDAVAAMKKGAFDFLQKPVDPEALGLAVRRAAEHRALLSQVQTLRDQDGEVALPARLDGSSAVIARVQALIAQVALTDATVLVSGESGSGKEVAARAIHAASARAALPCVRVACPALREERFEADLFGQRATGRTSASRGGALERAEGGTLVLDDVGSLSPPMQTRLAQVLESGEYQRAGDAQMRSADVRVVAITSEDLEARVKAGTLRADLYYRLAQFPLAIPALRARKADIPELAAQLLAHHAASNAGAAVDPTARLSAESLDVLASYDWPGNVRELANVLERAAIVCASGPISPELLRTILESGARVPSALREFNIRLNLDAREKELVLGALERAKGRKKDASSLLGIDARNLGYYLRKHKLSDASFGPPASDAD